MTKRDDQPNGAVAARIPIWRRCAPCLLLAWLLILGTAAPTSVAVEKPEIKALMITGGGYHDYEKLVPFLTNQLGRLAKATFDVKFGLETLKNPKFAEGYDIVVYDVCDDEAPDQSLLNALEATRQGKPAVMIHCAVHAFRRSPKIADWEKCCGMRSKVHDRYGPFEIAKLDPKSAITQFLPDHWRTDGDELYQTIAIDPESRQLLKAKSPQDGREHIVCWTYQFGKGRVFATTLGHDMKTTSTPEYLRLVSNGLLWACGKLEEGKAGSGAKP